MTLTTPETLAPSVATPILDDAAADLLDAMWTRKRTGFSRDSQVEKVTEYEQMLADLNARRITPRSVIGSGYKQPTKIARQWLTQSIGEAKAALATNGRTIAVNVSNTRGALRESGVTHMLADHMPTFGINDDGTEVAVSCACGHVTPVLSPCAAVHAWSVHA